MEIQLIQKLNQTRIWHNPLLSLTFWLMMTSSEREDQTQFSLLPGEPAPAAQLIPGSRCGFAQLLFFVLPCKQSCLKFCCEGARTSKIHWRIKIDVAYVKMVHVFLPLQAAGVPAAWWPSLCLTHAWAYVWPGMREQDRWVDLGCPGAGKQLHIPASCHGRWTDLDRGSVAPVLGVVCLGSWNPRVGFHTPGTQLPGKTQQSPLTSHISKYLQPTY